MNTLGAARSVSTPTLKKKKPCVVSGWNHFLDRTVTLKKCQSKGKSKAALLFLHAKTSYKTLNSARITTL